MNAKLIKELRDISGAGLMDCKKALVEADGDFFEAIPYRHLVRPPRPHHALSRRPRNPAGVQAGDGVG